jgi:hypothetical protein
VRVFLLLIIFAIPFLAPPFAVETLVRTYGRP